MVRVALIILLFANPLGAASGSLQAQSVHKEERAKPYKFTKDWFSGNIPLWTEVLAPFKGKPNIHYLEIGVFGGPVGHLGVGKHPDPSHFHPHRH